MPCYHPMIRDKTTGKVLGCIPDTNIMKPNYQLIPCGKCIGCRLEYSRQWAIRCQCESKVHPDNKWFLTLTYDNEHIPTDYSLNRKDFNRFLDNIRHNISGVRYFGCGEYGEQFQRPHYHLIVWNLPLKDIEYARKSKTGLNMYKSQWLNERWGRGEIIIGEVNWETSAYVARYVTKKHTKEENENLNRENEFITMSRRPGIGRDNYEKNKEKIYSNDEMAVLTSKNNPTNVRPPKSYDRIFRENNEQKFEEIRRKREAAARRMERLEKLNTSLDHLELLQIKENTTNEKIKSLTRQTE